MICTKCKSKMIPFGSPAERRKHPEYTLYGCPKCGNVSTKIRLARVKKAKR